MIVRLSWDMVPAAAQFYISKAYSSMTSVGEILRSARETQGRSLAEIAEELCITQRYLRALECDDLSNLPGAFFYKSFVKQYVNKVVDKMLGAPLGMEYEEAFEKAKNVDPTLDDAKFKQQVEQERINRLTSTKTRTVIRGSTEESTERAHRMERYGF